MRRTHFKWFSIYEFEYLLMNFNCIRTYRCKFNANCTFHRVHASIANGFRSLDGIFFQNYLFANSNVKRLQSEMNIFTFERISCFFFSIRSWSTNKIAFGFCYTIFICVIFWNEIRRREFAKRNCIASRMWRVSSICVFLAIASTVDNLVVVQ